MLSVPPAMHGWRGKCSLSPALQDLEWWGKARPHVAGWSESIWDKVGQSPCRGGVWHRVWCSPKVGGEAWQVCWPSSGHDWTIWAVDWDRRDIDTMQACQQQCRRRRRRHRRCHDDDIRRSVGRWSFWIFCPQEGHMIEREWAGPKIFQDSITTKSKTLSTSNSIRNLRHLLTHDGAYLLPEPLSLGPRPTTLTQGS